VHPVSAGRQLLQCDLTGYATAAECVAAVERYAAAHPDRAWITGGGWAMPVFPGGLATRDLLDAVVADRPVYLPNADGHGAWVNGAALARAGIDRHTPDPPDGRIERDAAGEPTGMLHEGAATLVGKLLPAATAADLDAALLAGQEYLFSHGITAWQDAIVGDYLGGDDNLAAYLRAAGSGALRARVVGALWWDRGRGAEQVADLVERRAAGRVGRFAATTVKIMQDGVVETRSTTRRPRSAGPGWSAPMWTVSSSTPPGRASARDCRTDRGPAAPASRGNGCRPRSARPRPPAR